MRSCPRSRPGPTLEGVLGDGVRPLGHDADHVVEANLPQGDLCLLDRRGGVGGRRRELRDVVDDAESVVETLRRRDGPVGGSLHGEQQRNLRSHRDSYVPAERISR
ncbi:hypothetical protein [Haloarcula laminariae]|uniref:hypothetical protein n=1 Tax=Haloarcula laminariae TaxID=2961577 RepID=UPI0021CAE280|nr:hypothetical protein [Halomicroarcula laminariae]